MVTRTVDSHLEDLELWPLTVNLSFLTHRSLVLKPFLGSFQPVQITRIMLCYCLTSLDATRGVRIYEIYLESCLQFTLASTKCDSITHFIYNMKGSPTSCYLFDCITLKLCLHLVILLEPSIGHYLLSSHVGKTWLTSRTHDMEINRDSSLSYKRYQLASRLKQGENMLEIENQNQDSNKIVQQWRILWTWWWLWICKVSIIYNSPALGPRFPFHPPPLRVLATTASYIIWFHHHHAICRDWELIFGSNTNLDHAAFATLLFPQFKANNMGPRFFVYV